MAAILYQLCTPEVSGPTVTYLGNEKNKELQLPATPYSTDILQLVYCVSRSGIEHCHPCPSSSGASGSSAVPVCKSKFLLENTDSGSDIHEKLPASGYSSSLRHEKFLRKPGTLHQTHSKCYKKNA
jgi:hypothetical protein